MNYMQRRRRKKKHKKRNTATFGKRRSELQNEIHRQKQKEVHKPRTIFAACSSSSRVVNCALESALHHQHGFIPNEIVLNFTSRAGRGVGPQDLILVHFLSFVLCFVIILFLLKGVFGWAFLPWSSSVWGRRMQATTSIRNRNLVCTWYVVFDNTAKILYFNI
jgi:hypothetical protein